MTITDQNNPATPSPESLQEPAADNTATAPTQPPVPKPAKARGSLESLLRAWDKAEAVRADTEALKPQLEAELATGMDSGEVLNENVVRGLQLKRMMLEMIPGKFAQIERREAELTAEIRTEFNARSIAYHRQFDGAREILHRHFDGIIRHLMAEDYMVGTLINNMLIPHTKLHRRIASEIAYIQQRNAQGDVVGAARELLKREPEAAAILAEAASLANQAAK